jgi:hypothetical protein
MRVVMFRGKAVRRQQKIGDDKILVSFYNAPACVVSVREWEAEKTNKFTDGNIPRRELVKNL